MNAKEKEDALTLEILQTIEGNEEVTQRHLADRLGVALGLANSYLKRCARKGYIKIQQVPANRYLYYLTPQGFAEKSRLTAEYLSYSFDFYRKASDSVNLCLAECHEAALHNIVLVGVSELAEIASVRLHEHELNHIATLDKYSRHSKYLGKPVWRNLQNHEGFDASVITALLDAETHYNELLEQTDKSSIFCPKHFGAESLVYISKHSLCGITPVTLQGGSVQKIYKIVK